MSPGELADASRRLGHRPGVEVELITPRTYRTTCLDCFRTALRLTRTKRTVGPLLSERCTGPWTAFKEGYK
jgi:hypothetical protein